MRPLLGKNARAPLELLRESAKSVLVSVLDCAPHFFMDFLNVRVHLLCALDTLFQCRPRLAVGCKTTPALLHCAGDCLRDGGLQISHKPHS